MIRTARAQKRATGRRWSAAAALVTVPALLLSCSSGDADATGGGQGEQETANASPATSTTQPSAAGAGEEEAFAIVDDLVTEATGLADELYQDPDVVNESDNEDIARLRELYTDDSSTPDQIVANLERLADAGQRVQAAASGIFREFAAYQFEAPDEDTVRFAWCGNQDQEVVDADGEVVERVAEVAQGVGEARRIDGVWRLWGLDQHDDLTVPIEPGHAVTGACSTLDAEDQE